MFVKEVYSVQLKKKVNVFLDDEYAKLYSSNLSVNKEGYVRWKGHLLHRILMNEDEPDEWVDHIDGNRANNTIANLRVASWSLNAHNRVKRQGTKSKYVGVYKDKGRFTVRIQNGRYCGQYEDELHAAYAFDLAAKEIFGAHARLNGVEEPENFILWVPRRKNPCPTGICQIKNGLYKVAPCGTWLGQFRTLEDATKRLDEYNEQKRLKKEQELLEFMKSPVEKDVNGNAIIQGSVSSSKGPITIIVDEDKWHSLKQIHWCRANGKGYAAGIVDGKRVQMHRYIYGCTEKKVHIDHINGNKLDNRLCNLRRASPSTNNQNVAKNKGKFKYTGVSGRINTGIYRASISVGKGKTVHLGSFNTEEEAAWIYDQKALELHGEHALINGVQEPENITFRKKRGRPPTKNMKQNKRARKS
jgi:hypothetical protein